MGLKEISWPSNFTWYYHGRFDWRRFGWNLTTFTNFSLYSNTVPNHISFITLVILAFMIPSESKIALRLEYGHTM
jgi:hypothetical protein